MGAKLLWNLIAPKPSWCSKVLKAKYFSGLRLRCLDGEHVNQKGTSIYNVCLKALPTFKEELYWVPGNGKLINIWHDKILGKDLPQIPCLQERLTVQGMNTLWDLSNWETEMPNRWAGWNMPDCPPKINAELKILTNHLAGLAPVAKFKKDRGGWGRYTGNYSAAEGYQRYAASYNVPANPRVWKNLWNCSTLPKIDMFSWSLTHERILTGENLQKRGITGPFRCPLCIEAAENISHLFLKCPYTISVWEDVLKLLGGGVRLPDTIQDWFTSWEKQYHGELIQKNGIRDCWLKLPKLICWGIWNERNHRIFQEKAQPAWKIASKVNALLGEIVSISKIPINKGTLTEKEGNWMKSLKIMAVNEAAAIKMEEWDIRMDCDQFESWLKEKKTFKLFFDGASKGNPGKAGGWSHY